MPNTYSINIIKELNDALLGAFPPYQVFVQAPDNSTLTLTLPNGSNTPIQEILDMISAKIAMSIEDGWLSFGGKPLKAELNASDYNIQRNSTLTFNGRLKGGFGERAAIISTASKDIKRGNVKGDIKLTKGESKALKDWARDMYSYDSLESKDLINSIIQEGISKGLIDATQVNAWWQANSVHVMALIIETAHGGNCGDYTQVVHSHLLENTDGQYVYQVVMKGRNALTGSKYDHQFVVTSPTDHGTNAVALAADANAMVADAWWANQICSFVDFVGGKNPYRETLTPSAHLEIVESTRAEGRKLDANFKTFIEGAVSTKLNAYKSTVAFTTEATYNDTNVETLGGTFGNSAHAWGNTMKDLRSKDDVYLTVNNAFVAGTAQFIAECDTLEDVEFINYALNKTAQMDNVWNTPATKTRLLDFCNTTTPNNLTIILNKFNDARFIEYAQASLAKVLGIPATKTRLFTWCDANAGATLTTLLGLFDAPTVLEYAQRSTAAQSKVLAVAASKTVYHNSLKAANSLTFSAFVTSATAAEVADFLALAYPVLNANLVTRINDSSIAAAAILISNAANNQIVHYVNNTNGATGGQLHTLLQSKVSRDKIQAAVRSIQHSNVPLFGTANAKLGYFRVA